MSEIQMSALCGGFFDSCISVSGFKYNPHKKMKFKKLVKMHSDTKTCINASVYMYMTVRMTLFMYLDAI